MDKLNWRYSVKRFDPSRKISDENWKVLEEALRLSPSSYGVQPWKFILVKDAALRDQLKAASWNQSQVSECSHFLVFLYKHKMDLEHVQKYVDKVATVRGLPVENLAGMKNAIVRDIISGPRSQEIHFWAQRQCYIAMGILMQSAAILEIDTCPMEGLDPQKYDHLLGLENGDWKTVAAVACGYRSPGDQFQFNKKVRFDYEDIFSTR